jgi:hypothetical protein
MDFILATVVALFIGGGLLVGLIALIIHPRVDQLISGDWLPEPEGSADAMEPHPSMARTASVHDRSIPLAG